MPSAKPLTTLFPVQLSPSAPEPADIRRRRAPGQTNGRIDGHTTSAAGHSVCLIFGSQDPNADDPTQAPPDKTAINRARAHFRRWAALSLAHSWLAPLLICLAVPLVYLCNPSASNPLRAALFVSYPHAPGPDGVVQYGKGPKDLAFVGFYVVLLTFTREFCMQVLLKPLAVRFRIKPEARRVRFMEQAYTAMYFSVFGPFGLYVMSQTDVWFFNTAAMYEGFPHRTHDALFKAYYLLQAAYWAQQMVVMLLMLEKPRKDFKELIAHHIITLSLIWLSYKFHFTRMGLLVYITHDVSDFFLAVSIACCGSSILTASDIQGCKLPRHTC
jgi:acyl-CoA-dependent ceramide synthase